MWFMEQKVITFQCRTDIRYEPARPEPTRPSPTRPGPVRPWRSLTAFFSIFLKDMNLKVSHNKVIDLKIVVSNFQRDFVISSEVLAFYCKDGRLPFLYTFLRIAHEPLNIFKIWLSHVEERSKIYHNHYRLQFKNKFCKVWILLFSSALLFRKIGSERAYYGRFTQLKLEDNFSSKK